jgi:hypothetical protein
MVRVENDPVLESAHRIGRELREIGSAGVTRAVAADLEEELDAVTRAGCGDLSGRAQQAVMLTRVVPSPAQIAVADRLLHEVPMGAERLYTDVEPAAAAVAAIHWFLAAVSVTASLAKTSPDEALDQAVSLEYFDDEVPRTVLRMSASDREDRTPLGIAQQLLHMAVLAGRGMLLATAEAVEDGPYFTALDPARPARCLLDGMIGGIQGIYGLYAACLDPSHDPECDEVEWLQLARRHFDAAVRVEASNRAPERLAELVVPEGDEPSARPA